MQMCQPWPSSPSRLNTGTRTSSRKISANPRWPSILAIGLTVTPGASSGKKINESPLWRSLPGARNKPKAQSANAARDDQILWPFSTYCHRRAWQWSERAARSLPACGSDQACAQISSPAAIGGRKRAFCARVPNSISVGPSRKIPFWLTRPGAPAR